MAVPCSCSVNIKTINWGLIFTEEGQFMEIVDDWKHTFTFEIPNDTFWPSARLSFNQTEHCGGRFF